MAVYHLATKIVSRGKGHSAVAAAAYRARMEITNERTGETWNYSRNNADVLFEGVFTPAQAPDWMRDRRRLWNSLEKAERQHNAQVARDFTIALPNELNLNEQKYALQDWVKENFTRRGFVADVAIHRPSSHGDTRNIHAHVLVSMRQVEGEGFKTQKYRSDNRKDDLAEWRQSWERIGNAKLVRFGHEPTLDHRSHSDRGIDLTPTIHLGPDAAKMEREGKATDRGDTLRAIYRENAAKETVARIEREAVANANAKAQQTANDDAPERAAPEHSPTQSAIDRMKAEERAEQIETLRDIGRNRWQSMGDQMRGIFSALRSLTATMGGAILDIVKGSEFFSSRSQFEYERALRESDAKPPAEAGTGVSGQRIEKTDRKDNQRGEIDRKAAADRADEAERQRKLAASKAAQQNAATTPVKDHDDVMKVLERMAAEKRAARDKEAASRTAQDQLRRDLGRTPPKAPRPKRDI